jgi:hypothetical protein
MSLVICSNEISGGDNLSGDFQAPYSFHNHLQQPLRIPANSEVAVQSLKVNKEGSVTLNPANVWYQYFGVKLTNDNKDLTTSAPHYVDMGIDGVREATINLTASDFIQPALSRGVPNPETYGLPTAAPKRDAAGNDFLGWDLKFQQRGNGSALDNKPTNWTNKFATTGAAGGLSFNSASNILTPTGKTAATSPFNQAIASNTPLALNGGEFIVDISNLGAAGNITSWGVGLTRCQTTANQVNTLYNPNGNSNTAARLGRLYYPEIECDFLVGGLQDFGTASDRYIKAYHLAENASDAGYDADEPLSMISVDYRNNGSFTDFYDWSTNNANLQFTKLKYSVNNELVKCELYSASTKSWHVLVDTAGVKGERFKPVADTCRNLYPFVFIQGKGSNPQPTATIDKWSGREISNFTYNNPNNDWWAYLHSINQQEIIGKVVDTRKYNQVNNASQHDYKGINASGTFEDYEYILVLKEDKDLYVPSLRANADFFLGYNGQTIAEKTSINSSSVVTFESVDTPILKSTTSIFVRLDNYNVKSYNAGQSTSSKIIYAAPRFSTGTDQSVGSLFFESPERVYVDLNNPNEMNANMFSISIVNENNTLATDLTGKSVCVLHFRQKKI